MLWRMALVAMLALGVQAQTPADLDARVKQFLAAFNNLDWPAFRDCFAEDATAFHPDPGHRERVSGEKFAQAWREVFDQIRKDSGKSAPPYMALRPNDLEVQVISPDVAVVTFHLLSPERFGRRTLVWKKSADGWRIVHLHASNFANGDAKR